MFCSFTSLMTGESDMRVSVGGFADICAAGRSLSVFIRDLAQLVETLFFIARNKRKVENVRCSSGALTWRSGFRKVLNER